MIIISSSETKKIQASNSTAIWEFLTDDRDISGAVADIKGRYPENGFALNQKSKEIAFVIAGTGHVLTPKQRRLLKVGDLIFLDAGESFAWEGTLTIFIATSPAFDPKQHILTS